ncbi:MAG: DUF1097 domain-containing protein [Clostridia bacterium]|nr:DUF1097 domain-containing protein [Clostridia bacterium]
MSFSKHLPIALFVALLAGVLQMVDQLIMNNILTGFNGFGWVAFLAWALYFLAGATPRNGVRAFIGYIFGIIGSVIIFKVAGWLGGIGFYAVPVGLFVGVLLLMELQRAPELFNLVPAAFIGAGAYFGICSYTPITGFTQAGLIEISYSFLGLFCGFLSIAFITWYNKNHVEEAESKK